VVLHALWGVTPHIRGLCEIFAEEGYETLAPSLLERWDPGFAEVDVDPARLEVRTAAVAASGWGEGVMQEVQAAIEALSPPVFVLGFCFGGTAAWLASSRCAGIAAASCFYGGHIHAHRAERPKAPVILHFGRRDRLIPLSDVADIEAAHPEIPVWLYDAGHAFVAPSDHHPEAARLALLRTRQVFHRASGAKEAGA
jgi:carboxymethylenebutenolidase